MERKTSVEESSCEVKKNEITMENYSNNEKTREIDDEKDCGSASCDPIENCESDLLKSPNATNIDIVFKKPNVIIGSERFRPEGKHSKTCTVSSDENTESLVNVDKSQEHPKDLPFPYVEPPWSGKPEKDYKVEVLKSGVIIETISLVEQSFFVIGRLPSCHISLAHPTISRHHAVLQYRLKEDSEYSKGLYVYDLGSTHGTFWNGNRIKPNVYVRVQGGHMLRFGCSQRKFILQAPLDDQEDESPYTVSELKQIRTLELEKRGDQDVETSNENKESVGIDWGMGEDANEETDLQENPYACIGDEDLVLEDPKKTLRGWFEREGYDLQYKTEERGPGQFLCWVDLPMEDVVGHTLKAEALVKGKKKEAVVQCALEACKVLDKYGLLRQSHHEARKRKTRNWEAEDYYDSDEDNFLDRTGSIERKREQRMRMAGKLEEKVETYNSLLEKHAKILKRISHLTDSIQSWQHETSTKKETPEEDALDAFMSNLSSSALSKNDIAKMKLELQTLRKEEASVIKLLNLTRPANLPALVQQAVTTNLAVNRDKTNTNTTQDISKASKIQRSVFQRRKEKPDNRQVNGNSTGMVTRMQTEDDLESESEEESDTEDANKNENESLSNSSLHVDEKVCGQRQSLISNADAAAIVATTTDADNTDTTPITTQADTNTIISTISVNKSSREKKRRQERRKVVSCDQDIYADNYSMWTPPQGQEGDGKTSLNEKYGY
ncbi:kanadaptin [Halictus rubicundus]|uniref:kanadaptin n=1 Tax=Halictus rubicundus TaxID=77578 RepID=UPI0040354CEC